MGDWSYMNFWEDRFYESLEGKSREELTEVVDYCYSMANKLSKDYTSGKDNERSLWKQKAKMAIAFRDGKRYDYTKEVL